MMDVDHLEFTTKQTVNGGLYTKIEHYPSGQYVEGVCEITELDAMQEDLVVELDDMVNRAKWYIH